MPGLGQTPGDLRVLNLHIQPSFRLFGFVLGVCIASTILCATAPTWHSLRSDLSTYFNLKGTFGGKTHQRLQAGLCIVQLSLCAALLMSAGLMVRTFMSLRTTHPGFDQDHVVSFSIDPTMRHYDSEQTWVLQQRIIEETRKLPNVRAAAIANRSLMRGTGLAASVVVPGLEPSGTLNTSANIITPGYFDAMGIRIVVGRDFQQTDSDHRPTPSVVNEAFVRQFFKGRDPIGQIFSLGNDSQYQIIGVVSDINYRSMREVPPPLHFMLSTAKSFPDRFTLHVRTHDKPESVIQPVRNVLRSIDPGLPLYEASTLDAEIDRSLWQERVMAVLATTFGLFATALAGIGLYGILTYFVIQYRRELGVRIAIGAGSLDIARVVTKHVIPIIALGVLGGSILYIGVAQWIKSILYGVQISDPISIAAALALLAVIVTAAASVPTIRAIRLDPGSILKE
jgi:predicted permease